MTLVRGQVRLRATLALHPFPDPLSDFFPSGDGAPMRARCSVAAHVFLGASMARNVGLPALFVIACGSQGGHHMVFSAYSVHMQLAMDAQLWDGDVIAEDHHAYLKGFFYSARQSALEASALWVCRLSSGWFRGKRPNFQGGSALASCARIGLAPMSAQTACDFVAHAHDWPRPAPCSDPQPARMRPNAPRSASQTPQLWPNIARLCSSPCKTSPISPQV